jgi:hypothetical protein
MMYFVSPVFFYPPQHHPQPLPPLEKATTPAPLPLFDRNCTSLRNLISNLMYLLTGQIVALKNTAPTSNDRLGHLFYSEEFFDNFMSLTQKDDNLKEEFCQVIGKM